MTTAAIAFAAFCVGVLGGWGLTELSYRLEDLRDRRRILDMFPEPWPGEPEPDGDLIFQRMCFERWEREVSPS